MYAVADFPALTIECVIGKSIWSPPWSEPEVFFGKFLGYKNTVFIVKI